MPGPEYEQVMGPDVIFDSQPEPILPQRLFDDLAANDQAKASVVLQELKRLAEQDDQPRAREMLARVEELAARLAADPLSYASPEWQVRCVLRDWRYTVVEGHLLALAWLAAGKRFIPVTQATAPAVAGDRERIGEMEQPRIPAPPGRAHVTQPAEGPPAAVSISPDDELSPGDNSSEEAPSGEPLQLPLEGLRLRPRPDGPLPAAVFDSLEAPLVSPAGVLFQLNRLAVLGDAEACAAMDEVEELRGQLERGEPVATVSCIREDDDVVVVDGELACLAVAMLGGARSIPVRFMGDSAVPPEETGRASTGEARQAVAGPAPAAAEQPMLMGRDLWESRGAPTSPAAELPPGAIPQRIQARIEAFREEQEGLPGFERARRLADLQREVAQSLSESQVRLSLEADSEAQPYLDPSQPVEDYLRERAARQLILRAGGLSRSVYYRLLKADGAPPGVKAAGRDLTLHHVEQILRLPDAALQEAVAAVVSDRKLGRKRTRELVQLLLAGLPLQDALSDVLGEGRGLTAVLEDALGDARELLAMLGEGIASPAAQEKATRKARAVVQGFQDALAILAAARGADKEAGR